MRFEVRAVLCINRVALLPGEQDCVGGWSQKPHHQRGTKQREEYHANLQDDSLSMIPYVNERNSMFRFYPGSNLLLRNM